MHSYVVLEHHTSLVTLCLKLNSIQDFCHPCNTAVQLVFLHSEGNLLWVKTFPVSQKSLGNSNKH